MSYKKQMEWIRDNHFEIIIKKVSANISEYEEAETVGSKHHYKTNSLKANVSVAGQTFDVELIKREVNESVYDGESGSFSISDDFVLKTTEILVNNESLGINLEKQVNGGNRAFIRGGDEISRKIPEPWIKLTDKIQKFYEENASIATIGNDRNFDIANTEKGSELSILLPYIEQCKKEGKSKIDSSKYHELVDFMFDFEGEFDKSSLEKLKRLTSVSALILDSFESDAKDMKVIDIADQERRYHYFMSEDAAEEIKQIISEFDQFGAVDDEIKERIYDVAKLYQQFIIESDPIYSGIMNAPKRIRKMVNNKELTSDFIQSEFLAINKEIRMALNEVISTHSPNDKDLKGTIESARDVLKDIDAKINGSELSLLQWDQERTIKLRTLPEPMFEEAVKKFELNKDELRLQSDLNMALGNAPSPLRFIRTLSRMSSSVQDNMVYFAMKKDPEDISRILNQSFSFSPQELAAG